MLSAQEVQQSIDSYQNIINNFSRISEMAVKEPKLALNDTQLPATVVVQCQEKIKELQELKISIDLKEKKISQNSEKDAVASALAVLFILVFLPMVLKIAAR